MNRRGFIQKTLLTLSTLWSAPSFANTVLRQLGPSVPAYIKKYFERLYKFMNTNYFSFEKRLNSSEKELISAWKLHLKEWGVNSSDVFFEFFLFSHKLQNKKVNSSRFAMGHNQWTTELLALVNRALQSHGLSPLQADTAHDKFFGLGWDLELSQIKIYRLHTTAHIPDKHLAPLSLKHSGDLWETQRISAFTYQKGKLIKKKLIVPLKEMDWSLIEKKQNLDVYSAMKILDCGPNGESLPVRWHFRLRSFFLGQAAAQLHPIISSHFTEFDQLMDSVVYESPQEMTVYYP